jgi:uncharacterized protein
MEERVMNPNGLLKTTVYLVLLSTLAGESIAQAPTVQAPALQTATSTYMQNVTEWRANVDKSLRRDNGWLTLAGRYVMKMGNNTIGTAKGNDIVLPAGVGPEKLGTMIVTEKGATLKLEQGVSMLSNEMPFEGKREMKTGGENRDWVKLGRMAFHVIERNGKYVLRLADNENANRSNFAGRVWFDTNESYRVKAKYVPYAKPKMISIVNVIDEIDDSAAPGYLEFKLNGKTHKLDALGEPTDKDLFVILKDDTAGKETYGSGRFLAVEWPKEIRAKGGDVMIDFNKTYNPPCAFSDYTTCPLPPKQNVLTLRLEAGEKYRARS